MKFFPTSATLFVDLNEPTPKILGMAHLRIGGSLSHMEFEGILHNSIMASLYSDKETSAFAYLGGGFFQVYFVKLRPIAECSEFTYLYGALRSSGGLQVPTPRLKFNSNSNFHGIVKYNCFKDRGFSAFADRLTKSVDESGESSVEYYPCTYKGQLGICFNANLVL